MEYFIMRALIALSALGLIGTAVMVFIAIWTVDPVTQHNLFATAIVAFFISIGVLLFAGPNLEGTEKPIKSKDHY